MVFSSIEFIFLFLPLVLGLYVLIPHQGFRNIWLLTASLFFYAWGEATYTVVMLGSIGLNYVSGLLIHRLRHRNILSRCILGGAVCLNLGLLLYFKYANFLVESLLNPVLSLGRISQVEMDPVHLPIGISFFTFQAMSYVIDLYRGETNVQRNPLKLGLYISMFPQLIAGPIVRYHDVAEEISHRRLSWERSAKGIRIFTVGFGKKMILANTFGMVADEIFALSPLSLSPGVAWIGITAYTLQIFFDFSGYSDMAIGLGHLLGFHFPENFRYPYIAKSIKDFWSRWHISLSTWFRDYLYIPLGGNRRGGLITSRNLLTVFLLCGLWHGASWNFIIWGIYHGAFLIIERIVNSKAPPLKFPSAVQHLYALVVVMIGWVFFRAETLPQSLAYVQALFGSRGAESVYSPPGLWLEPLTLTVFPIALLAATPLPKQLFGSLAARSRAVAGVLEITGMLAVWILCAMLLVRGTHNPFIYFRF